MKEKTERAMLELPETVEYRAAHITTRTKKLGEGRYAAIGAVYYMGRRGLYLVGLGTTRRQAEKAVLYALECGKPIPPSWRGPVPDAAWESERRLRAMGG